MVGRFTAQVQEASTEVFHSLDHLLITYPNVAFLHLIVVTKAVAVFGHPRSIVDHVQAGLHGRIQRVHILFLD